MSTTNTVRVAGLAAVAFGIALIVEFLSSLPVQTSDDDITVVLNDINDARGAFIFNVVWSMADVALFLPVLAGLFIVLRPGQRLLLALASAYFVAGTALQLVKGALSAGLVGLASDYEDASGALQESIAQDARLVQDLIDASVAAGVGALAIGIILVGTLLLGSQSLPRWLGWVAVAMGVLAVPGFVSFAVDAFFVFWLVVFILQIVWLFGLGAVLWRRADALTAASTV